MILKPAEVSYFNPLSGQFHKMVKHTQTNCLSVFGHFVGLALKGLKNIGESKKTVTYDIYFDILYIYLSLQSIHYSYSVLIT